MAGEIVKPDLKFINEVIASGGESLKKCFQCATCSVVCNVTPESKPFPRKEMVQAQWGLKDKLFSNPDIWLCHQCSDCTAYCPRGAKPGEVLGAVRKLSLEHYSTPGFLARAVGSPKALIPLLGLPVAIFLSYIGITGKFAGVARGEDGGIVYSKLIPTTFFIDPLFIAAAVFALFAFWTGIGRYWKDMANAAGPMKGDFSDSLIGTIKEILAHRKFDKCEVTSARKTSHLLVFYSFAGLAITTTIALVYLYGHEFFGITGIPGVLSFGESPYPLTDPLKILGNASALGLLIGITLVINNRFKNAEKAGAGSYYDWLFIGVVFGVMATGILAEVLRLANVAPLAYPTYIAHLSLVFFLFAYAPFSKMAHMVYRATAMVFAKQAGRE